jgi:hypothetical protein
MKPYFAKQLENKLFLCSDISLHHTDLSSDCYTIIGEIYPNSAVKEGDEFNEDDFYITEECPHYNGKHMWKDCSCKIGFVNGVYIKTKNI